LTLPKPRDTIQRARTKSSAESVFGQIRETFVAITYFKRFRMEFDLSRPIPPTALPVGYELLPWDEMLLEAHAETKYQCFRTEIDANVFPCLGDREGCRRLMADIARREGFIPQSTWLLYLAPVGDVPGEFCGTIQGLADPDDFGSIQNLGVIPTHRGRGLGTCLLHQSLSGFRQAGLRRATLEVTAQNLGAVRLYHRLGFRTTKTVYKASEVAYA